MPSQIEKILVPIDFSDISKRAARYAESLARALNATLYLVHVQPPAPRPHRFGPVTPVIDSREQSYQAARQRLDALARRLASETLHVISEVRTGPTAESIAQASVHYGADLVVMGTRGRTGVAHLLAGSVAERVVRTAPCPVLLVRGSGHVRLHRADPATKVA